MSSEDVQNEPVEQPDTPPPTRFAWLVSKLLSPVAMARAHPWITVAIGVPGLIVVAGVATWICLRPSKAERAARSAELALEWLDEGAFDEAKKLAEALRGDEDSSDQWAVTSLVLGAAVAKEAEEANPGAKGPLRLAAARYLEDALNRGLPDDRTGEAQFLLGRIFYETGQMEASRSALTKALESRPHRAAQIRLLLAAACLRNQPPRLAEAFEQNKLRLADDNLTQDERFEGFLQQAEILVAMGKPKECTSVLANIPAGAKQSAAAAVLRAQALLFEARTLKAKQTDPNRQSEAREKLQAALAILRDVAQLDSTLASASARRATYLIGMCLLESGDANAAMEQFNGLRTLAPGTPECLAAAFQEGSLRQTQKRNAEAAAAFCRALDAAGTAESLRNPWVSPESLRQRTMAAYQENMEARNFSESSELARRMGSLLSPERTLELQAEAHRAWGYDLIAQSETAPSAKAALLARQGRAQLRRASRLWEQLSGLRSTTRAHTEDLWEGAACALKGQDYRSAARMFEQYLKQEPRARRAQALTGLGKSLLCLDRLEEAVAALQRCIDLYPRDVAALNARLLASQALLDQGDVPAARRLLEENLSGKSLTPASREYRESLLALARLLHRSKRYDEAIRRLEEVVNRYGDSRQAIEARYLIADCHRRRVLEEAEKLKQDLVEQSRSARFRRMRDALGAALQGYRQAQEALLKCQESVELTPLETLMLRNTYCLMGTMLADMGQFDAAVKAYTTAASRYPNGPETLEAHVQMARAFRAMNRPDDARGSIEQAKLLLARMKPDTPFRETANYTKTEWAALLDREAGKGE
jgi:tetratricopeptide (TPR) repeat protein